MIHWHLAMCWFTRETDHPVLANSSNNGTALTAFTNVLKLLKVPKSEKRTKKTSAAEQRIIKDVLSQLDCTPK